MANPPKSPGRPPGSPNKLSSKTKDAIWEVFHGLGDVPEMIAWAKDNKGDFYTKVWARLIPQEFSGKFTAPPPPKTKADTDAEFARRVLYVLNAGIHETEKAALTKNKSLN